MEQRPQSIASILTAKELRRKHLSSLPIEEKVAIVIQMQKMIAPILQARGKNVQPWQIDVGKQQA